MGTGRGVDWEEVGGVVAVDGVDPGFCGVGEVADEGKGVMGGELGLGLMVGENRKDEAERSSG
jgi:hypothetical protein